MTESRGDWFGMSLEIVPGTGSTHTKPTARGQIDEVLGQETLAPPETALERRYALRGVKQRLHQASFREAVITAYKGRCAVSWPA
jgi:hypothetical protein